MRCVVIGPVVSVPVTELFAAAILPRVMLATLYMAYAMVRSWLIPSLALPCPNTRGPSRFFNFHFPALLLILYSFRVFIFMNKDGRFKRWSGVWFLGIYLVYLVLQYAFNLGAE